MTDSKLGTATAPAATSKQLVESLRSVGKEPVRLTSGSGRSLLVLPYGGRILGLFSHESAANFLWTHPALVESQTAREFLRFEPLAQQRWRPHLARAELDFFFPALPDTTVYVQPRPLDAGQFRVRITDAEVLLDTDFKIRSHRPGAELSLRLAKSIRLAADPLRTRHAAELGAELEFAGYQLHTSLNLLGPHPTNAWVGIWNLLQLPGGGELFAPTYDRTTPPSSLATSPRSLASGRADGPFPYASAGEQKICIPALPQLAASAICTPMETSMCWWCGVSWSIRPAPTSTCGQPGRTTTDMPFRLATSTPLHLATLRKWNTMRRRLVATRVETRAMISASSGPTAGLRTRFGGRRGYCWAPSFDRPGLAGIKCWEGFGRWPWKPSSRSTPPASSSGLGDARGGRRHAAIGGEAGHRRHRPQSCRQRARGRDARSAAGRWNRCRAVRPGAGGADGCFLQGGDPFCRRWPVRGICRRGRWLKYRYGQGGESCMRPTRPISWPM